MYVEANWNKFKTFGDISLYKPDVRNKNTTMMCYAAVYFSYFFYDDIIANYWMVFFKMCFRFIFLLSETKI